MVCLVQCDLSFWTCGFVEIHCRNVYYFSILLYCDSFSTLQKIYKTDLDTCIYNPLLYQATSKSGLFLRTISRTSSSRSATLMLAIWLKNAQPSGVAKISTNPTRPVWIGALAHGARRKRPLLVNAWMTIGVIAKQKTNLFFIGIFFWLLF